MTTKPSSDAALRLVRCPEYNCTLSQQACIRRHLQPQAAPHRWRFDVWGGCRACELGAARAAGQLEHEEEAKMTETRSPYKAQQQAPDAAADGPRCACGCGLPLPPPRKGGRKQIWATRKCRNVGGAKRRRLAAEQAQAVVPSGDFDGEHSDGFPELAPAPPKPTFELAPEIEPEMLRAGYALKIYRWVGLQLKGLQSGASA